MSKQSYIYDGLSLLLIAASLFFFFQATQFLLGKDYVASGLTVIIGFLVIRVGVEVGRLAIIVRRKDREHGDGQS